MRLDGFGLFVEDMARMIRFYRDVLGFEIKECEDTSNVYLVKDGTLFLLYGRKDFIEMFLVLRLKNAKIHQMFILLRTEHCFCCMEEKILKT